MSTQESGIVIPKEQLIERDELLIKMGFVVIRNFLALNLSQPPHLVEALSTISSVEQATAAQKALQDHIKAIEGQQNASMYQVFSGTFTIMLEAMHDLQGNGGTIIFPSKEEQQTNRFDNVVSTIKRLLRVRRT